MPQVRDLDIIWLPARWPAKTQQAYSDKDGSRRLGRRCHFYLRLGALRMRHRYTVDPRFGPHMRALREGCGLSLRDLERPTLSSKSKLHKIESGQTKPSVETARLIDDALDAGGELAAMVEPLPFRRAVPELPESPDYAVRGELVGWLSRRSGYDEEEIRQQVAKRYQRTGGSSYRRPVPSRASIAECVCQYYRPWEISPVRPYQLSYGGKELTLSVVVWPEWTGLRVPLSTQAEQADLTIGDDLKVGFDDLLVSAAARRIGEISASGTRVADTPLYRLVDVKASPNQLRVMFNTTTFIEYAMTMDLLESELVSATAGGAGWSELPVRDRLLPNLAAVTEVGTRTCVGGVVALFAAVREPDHLRSRPDVALLVQQRSNWVLNAVGRLATIPKGFHEPLTDVRLDARPSATLLREIEEELFRRDEVDSSSQGFRRHADPLHRTQLSEPMRWLIDRRGTRTWRAECVGIGLNLVSGNYEIACLVFVEDPQWWRLFGGLIEGNWETQGLRVYSLDDIEVLRALVEDPTWSNEGLFAFDAGVRRLQEIAGSELAGDPDG